MHVEGVMSDRAPHWEDWLDRGLQRLWLEGLIILASISLLPLMMGGSHPPLLAEVAGLSRSANALSAKSLLGSGSKISACADGRLRLFFESALQSPAMTFLRFEMPNRIMHI